MSSSHLKFTRLTLNPMVCCFVRLPVTLYICIYIYKRCLFHCLVNAKNGSRGRTPWRRATKLGSETSQPLALRLTRVRRVSLASGEWGQGYCPCGPCLRAGLELPGAVAGEPLGVERRNLAANLFHCTVYQEMALRELSLLHLWDCFDSKKSRLLLEVPVEIYKSCRLRSWQIHG